MPLEVFTPYGHGEIIGCRNDGISIVKLKTQQGREYLGYFHYTQIRQLSSHDNMKENAMEVEGGGGGKTQSRKRSMDEDEMEGMCHGREGKRLLRPVARAPFE